MIGSFVDYTEKVDGYESFLDCCMRVLTIHALARTDARTIPWRCCNETFQRDEDGQSRALIEEECCSRKAEYLLDGRVHEEGPSSV